MKKNINEIIEIIAGLREEIKDKFKADVVGVFGSYARGAQKESSDTDILVKFHAGATLLDLVGLSYFLEEKLNLKVDIVPVDTIREEIRERVLKEAVYL